MARSARYFDEVELMQMRIDLFRGVRPSAEITMEIVEALLDHDERHPDADGSSFGADADASAREAELEDENDQLEDKINQLLNARTALRGALRLLVDTLERCGRCGAVPGTALDRDTRTMYCDACAEAGALSPLRAGAEGRLLGTLVPVAHAVALARAVKVLESHDEGKPRPFVEGLAAVARE